MNLPAFARISLSLALTGVVASCGLATSQPTAIPSSLTASPSTRSTAPTGSATATPAIATVVPAVEPSPTPPPTDSPPPRGILSADETDVEGWLGTYCWHGLCADVPGAPAKEGLPHMFGDGNEIEFSLSDDTTFHTWRATYASESDATPTTLGQGGQGFDPDASPVAQPELLSSVKFASPPGGDWVIFVQVFLEDGDLSYAWHLQVPLLPPAGVVRAGNANVEGQLGSWCYDFGCADTPPFAKELYPALDTRKSTPLTFTFTESDQFAFAEAQYSLESDFTPLVGLASAGASVDPDTTATQGPLLTSFTFDAPPRGDWVLTIRVRFPGDLGDAPYNWHAIVH